MAALVLGLALLSAAPAAAAARDPLPDAIRREAARIRWTAALTERLIREMPKVETHVHLDGTLTSGLIQELANAQGLPPFAGKSLEEIRRVAVVDSPRGSLQQVLDAFATFLPLLKRPEAVERVAHEVVKSARRQNIRHVEVRFAPVLHETRGFPLDDVLAAALRGLERGRGEWGVSSGVIVCLIRPFELVSREQNERMLELAIRHAGRGVAAIDLAGNEAAAPLSAFRDFYGRA
jgi:adenosine deaminase